MGLVLPVFFGNNYDNPLQTTIQNGRFVPDTRPNFVKPSPSPPIP
jgi:hypothetical protein